MMVKAQEIVRDLRPQQSADEMPKY